MIIDLEEHGDPIYAGMPTIELTFSVLKLRSQLEDAVGHFHYDDETELGDERRDELAKKLYDIGLR